MHQGGVGGGRPENSAIKIKKDITCNDTGGTGDMAAYMFGTGANGRQRYSQLGKKNRKEGLGQSR